jgi:hypothetical protein
MGQNKQQREAAARAKATKVEATKAEEPKATPAPTPAASAQPTATAAPPAATPAASKQTATLDKLKAAWTARGLELGKLTAKPDGKYLMVTVADGWPPIQLGSTGGIVVPALRSYASAFDAAVHADELYAKQQARDAKKLAAAQPKAPAPAVAKSA